jgi:PAS domain S-box-containing protein
VSVRPTTVLVADDRPANRYAIVHALTRSGFEVIEASTGKEALELARELPNVILLDVKLPDILGYEVCRRIKANPHTSHIPVLQVSAAFVNNESRVYALESGADAYLIQPVEPSVLVATVNSLVRLQEAESQARLSAKQWQATFDALSEGVALVDSEGIIQRCNRTMTSLLGWSYSKIENLSLSTLIHECFGLKLECKNSVPVQEAESKGRYFRFSLDPIFLQEVNTGSIFILSEVTEQKRAERALIVSERLAATGRMANTIAHEINNPLAAITNLLYLLERSLDSPAIAGGYLDSAQAELGRVSRIARQILSFNRESASPVPVNLGDLIEDVLALNNRAVIEKNLRIEKDWDDTVVICGFPAQLRQVFSNLVRNAIEASHQGKSIHIRVSSCTMWSKVEKEAARVTISDSGIGIATQYLPRIFDAFFTTKELKGSGVGLWLSSTIVQEHRGRIQVRSRTHAPGSGTCISVILPRE